MSLEFGLDSGKLSQEMIRELKVDPGLTSSKSATREPGRDILQQLTAMLIDCVSGSG